MVARFLIIYYPLTGQDIVKHLFLLFHFYWKIPLVLSLLRVFWVQSSNILCMPFSDQNPTNDLGHIIILVCFVVDCVVFLLTFALISIIPYQIQASAASAGRAWSVMDHEIVIRTGLHIVINFVRWSLLTMYVVLQIMSLQMPRHLVPWVSQVVLPLNAILNPIIYKLSTKQFHGQCQSIITKEKIEHEMTQSESQGHGNIV